MKTVILSLILALSASSMAFAQSGSMKPMDQKGDMGTHKCMDMKDMGAGMKGMDMNDNDMQKCKEMMDAKGNQQPGKDAKAPTHAAVAVVKNVDVANGKVTLAHEAISSLKWPAMTMAFAVKDKTLFDKLAVGKKVDVELMKEGKDYVVVAVK
jgi:Cu(I)/Ag(I) efflux system protein CusF